MSLRRFFPSVRADYIRVQGKGWVDDANNRFTSIDFRGPVISIIDRVISAILDDLPKKFALADGGRARRTELPIIPYKAIREAVVNAFMHRNYKIDRPIQIIRYSNRLVIENPGHSMKPQDQFDRNGSIARNPNIAALLNETDFAETKGTGMRTMRLLLQQAGLSSPAFESERESDIFRVTFLFHQLLDEVTLTWLSRYKEHNLSSDECLALAYVKEAGQISNLTLRELSGVDTLGASGKLRRLTGAGLLEKRGNGAQTFYVASSAMLSHLAQASSGGGLPDIEDGLPDSLPDKPSLPPAPTFPSVFSTKLKGSLMLLRLGKRASPSIVKALIVEMCQKGSFSKDQLSEYLHRDPKHVLTYLSSLLKEESIRMTLPHAPNHPEQKYTAVRVRRHRRESDG
ncbi:ATP-dependent DNA helicase recG-like protein [Methylosinus sp. sav-2]|uniref:ATP-binding protein n=1 Tax=Methylosinus sp. sav-2 TaxID=2485168 RepID=UPI000A07AEE5|nr:ATP-binding protein [Methylosinus sp. sav-2]TDX60262.1 ATP-dependent DNA helicase recG-like protein [Methylosinus sp. sav-2]